jgi:hypothetical protein
MIVDVYDDAFSSDLHQEILEYCQSSKRGWLYGESDEVNGPITGLAHYLPEDSFLRLKILNEIWDKVPEMQKLKCYQAYFNLFVPGEIPFFHQDDDEDNNGITALYYPQDGWKLDDGGETQFVLNNSINGIPPIANRLVLFDAHIVHRATSFRSRHRFTLALKFR